MPLRRPTSGSLPVLLREDGRLELTEVRQRPTRWGILTLYRGFISDLASVPSILRGLIAASGPKVNLPALFHDLCCEDLKKRHAEGRALDEKDPDGPMIGPRNTDVMFREALAEYGTPPLMCWLYWEGVRWGAAVNPARRPGWWRDLPLLVLLTVLTAPITIGAGIPALVVYGVYTVAESVTGGVLRLFGRTRTREDQGPDGDDPRTDT